jgi:hypothetical protein
MVQYLGESTTNRHNRAHRRSGSSMRQSRRDETTTTGTAVLSRGATAHILLLAGKDTANHTIR